MCLESIILCLQTCTLNVKVTYCCHCPGNRVGDIYFKSITLQACLYSQTNISALMQKKNLSILLIFSFCYTRLVCNLRRTNPFPIITTSGDHDTSSRSSHISRPCPLNVMKPKLVKIKEDPVYKHCMSVSNFICFYSSFNYFQLSTMTLTFHCQSQRSQLCWFRFYSFRHLT